MTSEASKSEGDYRKLAVIMFTDIVGFSAMAQRDETRSLTLLAEHHALVRPLLTAFGGTEIKTIGDAFLVEFGSAVDAVACAIQIQHVLHSRNTDVSADMRVEVRVGLHLGDVVRTATDILGDGVNIAARIQPLAEPGGVCLSQQVLDQIRGKVDASCIEIPQPKLKNIDRPIRVYWVRFPWSGQARGWAERLSSGLRFKLGSFRVVITMIAAMLVVSILIRQQQVEDPMSPETSGQPIPAPASTPQTHEAPAPGPPATPRQTSGPRVPAPTIRRTKPSSVPAPMSPLRTNPVQPPPGPSGPPLQPLPAPQGSPTPPSVPRLGTRRLDLCAESQAAYGRGTVSCVDTSEGFYWKPLLRLSTLSTSGAEHPTGSDILFCDERTLEKTAYLVADAAGEWQHARTLKPNIVGPSLPEAECRADQPCGIFRASCERIPR